MTVIHHEAFYLTSFCHLVIQQIHKQKTQRSLYYRHCYVIQCHRHRHHHHRLLCH